MTAIERVRGRSPQVCFRIDTSKRNRLQRQLRKSAISETDRRAMRKIDAGQSELRLHDVSFGSLRSISNYREPSSIF